MRSMLNKNESISSARLGYEYWLLIVAFVWWWPASITAAVKWEEIPAEQREAQPDRPEVAEAGAEVLLARRRFTLNDSGMIRADFFRIKLYAERLSEKVGRVIIPVVLPAQLEECGARLVRAGAVVKEYSEKDFKRTKAAERAVGSLTRTGIKVDSSLQDHETTGRETYQLQIAELQTGDIVEYFYQIDENVEAVQGYGGELRVDVQEQFPIRHLEFFLGASQDKGDRFQFSLNYINLPEAKLTKQSVGGLELKADRVPAFLKEKDMPPENDVRAYCIMRFASGTLQFTYTNWGDYAKALDDLARSVTRPDSEIKKLASALTAGVTTPEGKLRRLYDYCQRKITNLDYDDLSGMTKPDRSAVNAERVLERRMGTAQGVTALFVSLARAGGFEATLAATTRGSEMLRADRAAYGWLFMNELAAAVKWEGKWHYYFPGMRWAAFGQTYWQNQGTALLLIEDKKPLWGLSLVTTSEEHDRLLRQGDFTLDEQGGLTGRVTETLSGQFAMIWRHQHTRKKAEALEKVVKARVQQNFTSAEIARLTVTDDHDNANPVVLSYDLSVPDFATQAGERIIFAPNILNARAVPRYTDTAPRLHPVRFNHGSLVLDQMNIQLPEGYELEAGDAPAEMDYSEVAGMKYQVKLRYNPKQRQISHDSTLAIGLGGKVSFPTKGYPALMQLFEKVNKAQIHTLVLKPKSGYTPPSTLKPVVAPASGESSKAETEASDNDASL